jgi:hypothetical protein
MLLTMKNRTGIVTLLLFATTITAAPVHAAAPTVGSSCAKLGSTVSVSARKFTCIQKGTKLVWGKGVVLPTATSPASATPTPTNAAPSAAALAPIPISLPVAAGPITFANILDNVSLVARTAYDSVKATYAANPQPEGIKSTIWVGPNTTMIGSYTADQLFNNSMKLWAGFNQPKTLGAFFFETQDEPAAEIAFMNWKSSNHIASGPDVAIVKGECQNPQPGPGQVGGPVGECRNANGGVIDTVGTGMGIFGVPSLNDPQDRSDPYRAGALELHEYTHMVQTAQFLGNGDQPGRSMQAVSPCWLQEGQAHLASKTTASPTFNDYLIQRNGEALSRTDAEGKVTPKDLQGISNYISLETLSTCQGTYAWGYGTGMLVVEALAAIGGVQSTMALYTEEARGHSFTDAFKLVYGVPWETAQPILAKVVYADYQQPDMNVHR